MISDSMQTVLDRIQSERHSLKTWIDAAKRYRDQETTARQAAEESEAGARQHEHAIESLSLELRKIMNGEPSPISVAAPLIGEAEQVGREG